MSPRVGSSSNTRRAKCSWANSPNGSSAFFGSAIPGCEVIDASSVRSAASCPARAGATTVKCDCGVTTSELQTEVDQALLVPVHLAQIELRADQADLGTVPVRDHRGLRVVEDDALLAVEPARALVELGDNRLQAEGQDAVLERPARGVEHLSLPAEVIDDLRDRARVRGARRDDGSAVGGAVRHVACGTCAKQIIELGLGNRQQLLYVVCHGHLLRSRGPRFQASRRRIRLRSYGGWFERLSPR